MEFFTHYRNSQVGLMLEESLEELLSSGDLSEGQAETVRLQFDRAFSTALSNHVSSKAQLKGQLHIYRNCDNVWTFILNGATLKPNGGEETEVDSFMRIYAPDSRQYTTRN
ncbi:hypothetical protein NDN08_004400 [Rhodosorus marinus]|uniref:Transcription initiation factor IIA subunit 2 n=1 Tax=Rhodosorus marinus TaxID=101924 RepID=A0AAV8UL96_9RHOD|nr:hypothetical protein NDN08_004400 [Rhodosorus marinus]